LIHIFRSYPHTFTTTLELWAFDARCCSVQLVDISEEGWYIVQPTGVRDESWCVIKPADSRER
jgi:hypothetical protein